MSEQFKDSLEFVAKHYKSEAFRPLLRFVPEVGRPWWRRRAAVASAACGAALLASAAFYFLNINEVKHPELPATPAPTEMAKPVIANELESKRIEFTDAPLSRVAEEIERVYGVTISGVPADTTVRLTLSYEGTAADLVGTINDLIDTNLTIAE